MWPSLDNPGMVKLLGNHGILGQGGHVCGHPWTILGRLSYFGIPGDLNKEGACVWPSLDNFGMAKLLGNPWILGQRGACVWPPPDNPGMAKLLGNPAILGQGGACVWPSVDNPGMAKLLGNPGRLGQGGRGMCVAIPGQSWDG